ncbi:copper amine oxidase N-terminal domain-containing protein [Vallitalea guaymasensis]|uniref:Copper amine oxidase N-terminal domain-containing protein n=1 Tax=Vallitalea guaymasensis TaxID=1185412 RepID=A0A8J8MCE2_9FIRM|nr:copper amine oxidase N-terminal domain-containing protein [Vallitalea guaymasensis]QUH30244.1 copper amine oxidase N-terminal domain-containing protein [Vallitalea guaymasensis]
MMLTAMMVSTVTAETFVTVTVQGETVDFPDAQPFIDANNRTLVPIRFISEALGGQVSWDGDLQQATITYDNKVIKLVINNKEITVDDKVQVMDTLAILKDSRTYVPVRFVSEAMGANVEWDSTNYIVTITLKRDTVDLKEMTNEEIIQQLQEYPYLENNYGIDFMEDDEWLLNRYGQDKIKEFVGIGKSYMETFYNVDYKTYNKADYIEKLKWFFLESSSWIADDRIQRASEEHINYWADMITDKQISMHTEFITDKTCIYTNGPILIRGRMNYIIENCNDMEWLRKYTRYGNVELGKQYTCVVDVEISNSAKNAHEKWETSERLLSDEHFVTPIKEVK